MEAGYGSPIGARDTVVVVDDARGHARRTSSPARTAPGFHLRNVNVPPRLHAGRDRRHHQRPRGRSRARTAASPSILRNGIEVGNIFKLGTKYTRGARARRTSARTASATRSSWAPTGSGSGATSPASSRPTTTRRASSGRPRWRRTRPTSWRSARNKDPQVAEIGRAAPRASRPMPAGPRDPVRRPRRVPGRQVHRRGAARACPGS